MKKNIIIGVIVLAIIVVAIILLSGGGSPASSGTNTTSMGEATSSQIADSPQAIVNDAKSLQVDDITKEFQNIDAQIKNL